MAVDYLLDQGSIRPRAQRKVPKRLRRACAQWLAAMFHNAGVEQLPEENILELLENYLRIDSRYVTYGATPEDLLTGLAGRDGVLVPVGNDSYQFIHLVIQEYLCAMQLFDNAAWRSVGHDLASMARWGEVLRFVAEGLETPEIEEFVHLLTRESSTRNRHADVDRLILVAQCISDSGIVSNSLVTDAFQQLLNLATSANRPGYKSDAIIVAAKLLKVYPILQKPFDYLLTQQGQSRRRYILMQILACLGLPKERRSSTLFFAIALPFRTLTQKRQCYLSALLHRPWLHQEVVR